MLLFPAIAIAAINVRPTRSHSNLFSIPTSNLRAFSQLRPVLMASPLSCVPELACESCFRALHLAHTCRCWVGSPQYALTCACSQLASVRSPRVMLFSVYPARAARSSSRKAFSSEDRTKVLIMKGIRQYAPRR